ncbi:MAG: hypothetical protein ACKOAL_04150, partial [Chthoniobacterales bacterium]
KPLGTFGHEVLVKIAGRDPVTLKEGSKVAGTEFAFAKFYATRDFSEEPIILISYRPLVERLGLDASRKRFSRKELAEANELAKLAQEAAALRQAGEPVPRLDTEAQTVLGRLQLFDALGNTAAFLMVPPQPGSPAGAPWLTVDQLPSLILRKKRRPSYRTCAPSISPHARVTARKSPRPRSDWRTICAPSIPRSTP